MQEAARQIVEKMRLHGHQALFAGGWVRDFLLGREPKDIDIATSAVPSEVLRIFPGAIAFGAAFGVVQVRMRDHLFEVATFRSEGAYLDGRHPSSVSFPGPEQDAQRRDFTINALFYDPLDRRVIDYVEGENDLRRGIIRTVGDPAQRFHEDKLRMLRALRLSCGLGFHIDRKTWEAIRNSAAGITQVSWERIRDELLKILVGPDAARGLALMEQSGLLRSLLPEIAALTELDIRHMRNALSLLKQPSGVLSLAVVFSRIDPAVVQRICRRLRLSNDEIERILDLVRDQEWFEKAQTRRISDLKRFLGKPYVEDRLELHRVNRIARGESLEIYDFCCGKIDEWKSAAPDPAPLVSGDDLIALGYEPGPLFKEILNAVEDLKLEGVLGTHEAALDYIRHRFPTR